MRQPHLREAQYVYVSRSTTADANCSSGEAAAPFIIPRMNYQTFDDTITNKYGVRIHNWPLSKFTSPGKLTCRTDLETLYYALKNGTTTFSKMTPTELEAWREERARRVERARAGHAAQTRTRRG